MYLTINLPYHIATLANGIFLLNDSHMISQLLKCGAFPPTS